MERHVLRGLVECCRELGEGWERVTQVVLGTERVHSRVAGTCYADVFVELCGKRA